MAYIALVPVLSDNTNVLCDSEWTSGNGQAWHLFDNNLSTYWSTPLNQITNHYCGYDFDESHIVSRIGINPRAWNNVIQMHDFRVDGSDDGVEWTTVYEGSLPNDASIAGQWQYFEFDNLLSFSKWRLFVLNANTSQTITIWEAQFFESDTPPVPPGPGFPIHIQRNNSESIHLDKDLTNILATQAVLKSDTSLIDPVLLIEVDLASVALANYVTIPQFNRSYFITNIRSITNDLVELTCHVDVLSSFAEEIRANTGIIRRNENEWNLYLNDGTLVSYSNPIVSTQEFPNGFTDQSYVLVVAGGRGGGVSTGEGGSIAVTGAESEEMGGNGNNNSKTTGGLVYYAYQQLGKPYWFGTFGNLATQSLLDYKRRQYSNYYPTPGNPDFNTQLGERVHDCVGLIKGYRWREDATMSDPVYNASQDVDVAGLYNQCIRYRGTVNPADTTATYPIGCILFNSDFTHCGVYIGGGELIEARGHFYGVVQNTLASRPAFAYWGIPDWMQVSEDYG